MAQTIQGPTGSLQSSSSVEPSVDRLPVAIVCLLWVAGHVVLWLLFSFFAGAVGSLFVVGLLACGEVALRVFVKTRLLESRIAAQTARDSVAAAIAVAPGVGLSHASLSSTASIPNAEVVADGGQGYRDSTCCSSEREEPVEIQTSGHPTRHGERIATGAPTQKNSRFIIKPFLSPPQRRSLPPKVAFFGLGSSLDLGRRILRDPLVYATAGVLPQCFDASLIEQGLPLAPWETVPQQQLPYWPSYRDSHPEQRTHYLEWLLGGRKNPDTALGYVFIFFYGLERRVFIDGADHAAVAGELIRLLSIYDRSNSFRGYASSFLWWTLYLGCREQQRVRDILPDALTATARWNDETLSLCLACFQGDAVPLPARAAMLLAKQDPRTKSRTAADRPGSLFADLFEKRYRATFGTGMCLKAAKSRRHIHYGPASATLRAESAAGAPRMSCEVPNVAGLTSQFKQLIDLWAECAEELKAFDRARRTTDGGRLTSTMYETLPPELRSGEHPEFEDWLRLWREHQTEDGPPFVPVSSFAALKSFSQRPALTKKQSHDILRTADALGFGVEPDSRLSGKNYKWQDRVAIFTLDEDQPTDMAPFVAASALLELGISVASADGQVDERELAHISHHLGHRFNLSADQAKRLDCRRQMLLHGEGVSRGLAASLQRSLTQPQRLLVGEFLVGIAAVDQIISDAEARELRRLYHALGLGIEDLDSLLEEHRPSPRSPDGGVGLTVATFVLDMAAVARKITDTQGVVQLLTRAMTSGVDSDEEGETTGDDIQIRQRSVASATIIEPGRSQEPSPTWAEGLEPRYRVFLQAVLERSKWQRHDADGIAREHRLMLSGAVEAINEWSQQKYGDRLIEDGEVLFVNSSLVQ